MIRRHLKIRAEAHPYDPACGVRTLPTAVLRRAARVSGPIPRLLRRDCAARLRAGLCNGSSRMMGNYQVRFFGGEYGREAVSLREGS
jgi:hypothetical protein